MSPANRAGPGTETVPAVCVRGIGVVSPAGWGVAALREALLRNAPLPSRGISRPGWSEALAIRQVPLPESRPAFVAHARLRRTSPIAHYTLAAALEALGDDAARCGDGGFRLGTVFCAMSGCVTYSRKFYSEVVAEPLTASPILFPETVYNSPASHLSAFLRSTALNYTLVGDPGTFLQGVALAADWLVNGSVDGCLVIGAEESDWITGDALRLFEPMAIASEGAGALYLGREPARGAAVRLEAITDPHLFRGESGRLCAAMGARGQVNGMVPDELLCDGLQGVPGMDEAERVAWQDWSGRRLSPKAILGEAFMAAAAWQCVAAVDALANDGCSRATVSVVGCNQQAIAARFARTRPS